MRDLRQYMITEPKDRFDRISSLVESCFSKDNALKEWDMKINSTFSGVMTKQLFHPMILDPQNNCRTWGEYEGKKFKHTEPL